MRFKYRYGEGIAGVDEVGRGCLAGPVYAAAVVLRSSKFVSQFRDSKCVSEMERDRLAPLIQSHHDVGIGFATVAEIEKINILQASFLAMRRALQSLSKSVELRHVLVDGHLRIPKLRLEQTPIVDGDAKVAAIGAASIVAKVTRDRVMRELASIYPEYGFEKHKGYATPYHREQLQKFGVCEIHRRTFGQVRELAARDLV